MFRNRNEYSISKEVMPEVQPWFHPTFIGFRHGAIMQYRDRNGGHIREYNDRFLYHTDKYNPETHPVEHLLYDNGLLLALLSFKMIYIASKILRK